MTYWEFAWPIYAGWALVVGLFVYVDRRCTQTGYERTRSGNADRLPTSDDRKVNK